MGRTKTERKYEFETLDTCRNGSEGMAGQWQSWFAEPQPLVAELGSGKCAWGVGYAALHPDHNVLCIDRKPERLWRGALTAQTQGLRNIRFLRDDITTTHQIFAPHEVSAIWVTFPDPYPKTKHSPRRMTGPRFLAQYARILAPGGWVHFKTDNGPLMAWTREVLAELGIQEHIYSADIHHSPLATPETSILTDYERRFLAEGFATQYLCFQLPAALRFDPKSELLRKGLKYYPGGELCTGDDPG